jgi:hypothetical protein
VFDSLNDQIEVRVTLYCARRPTLTDARRLVALPALLVALRDGSPRVRRGGGC